MDLVENAQGFSWKDIKNVFLDSPNKINIHERVNVPTAEASYKTPMEAFVNGVAYVEINHCLRILGTGDSVCSNMFEFTKYYNELFGDTRYIVAHDVFGGLFATAGTIWYFAPDLLKWEDLGISYRTFINWVATPRINIFYKSFLWRGAEETLLSKCGVDEGILVYPFLWTAEGKDIEKTTKKIVPFSEIMGVMKTWCERR